MRANDNTITNLQSNLEAQLPGGEWQQVMSAFVPMGVVDALQLRQISGMERTRLSRVLDKMNACSAGLPPLYHTFDQPIERPGVRGRQPIIYVLDETGAALLRALGHADARANCLKSSLAVAHALAMVEIHFAATRAGLQIQTDSRVVFSEGQSLRPDHVVTMPNGQLLMYEVEQSANSDLTRRVTESLEHKIAFFQSEAAASYLPEVRMVINLTRGTAFENTCALWKKVFALLHPNNQQPAFRLLAVTLSEFLQRPDWQPGASDIWRDLSQVETASEPEANHSWDLVLPERNWEDDLDLLSGLLMMYKDARRSQPKPSTGFLAVMRLIYEASHGNDRFVDSCTPPLESIFLLRHYLKLHPRLFERLQTEMHRGHGKVRWNNLTILHRMQQVVNSFLDYFGIGNGFAFRAVVSEGPGYLFQPSLYHLDIQVPDSGRPFDSLPSVRALGWVLWAIFEYSEELGLGTLEYW
jgi:hypothetical protein